MLRLIALLRFLNAGRGGEEPLWPHFLLRCAAVVFSFAISLCILGAVLASIGAFWIYEYATAQGYDSDRVFMIITVVIAVSLTACLLGLFYFIKDAKKKFYTVQSYPFTVTERIQRLVYGATQGFIAGFLRPNTKENL